MLIYFVAVDNRTNWLGQQLKDSHNFMSGGKRSFEMRKKVGNIEKKEKPKLILTYHYYTHTLIMRIFDTSSLAKTISDFILIIVYHS